MGIQKFGGETKYPCPICNRENYAHETFRCRRCGRQFLCVEHLDNREKVCESCVTVKQKDAEAAEGMVMVHGGEFTMGSADADLNAKPVHKLKIDAFMIDKNPITNAQYSKFNPDHSFREGEENEPVVGITWAEARDYAVWVGKRLPTEEQWEKAARGTDARPYPWGKDDPDRWLKGSSEVMSKALKRYNISPYGVRDLIGGPHEWTASTYEPYPEGDTSDPAYYEGAKVIRGGETGMRPSRTFDRFYAQPHERREDITFRCIKDIPKEQTLIQFVGFDIKSREEKEEYEEKRGKVESRHQAKPTPVKEYQTKPKLSSVEPPPRPKDLMREKITQSLPPKAEVYKPKSSEPAPPKSSSLLWIIVVIAIIIFAIIIFMVFMKSSAKGLNTKEAIYCIEHDEGKTFIALTNPGSKTITRISTSGSEQEPVVSKNGRLIGFISSRDGRPDIFVMNPDGKDWLNLTKGGGEKERPAFTPDGKKIYFAQKSSGNWDIFTCDTDGGNLAPVIQTPYNDYQPSISCDGKSLAYLSERGGEILICVSNLDGKQEKTIAKGVSMKSYPVFTPDPSVVAYRSNQDGNYEIYYADIIKGATLRGSETYRNEGRFDFNGAGDYIIMCWDNPLDPEPCHLFSIRWDGAQLTSIADDVHKKLETPCAHLGGMSGFWASKYHQKYMKPEAKNKTPLKKLVAMSKPKVVGPTGVTVKKGDLIKFNVQNWDLSSYYKDYDQWVMNGEKSDNPPNPSLMIEIGNSPRLYAGALNSFRSEWDGEVKLIYTGDKVIPPPKTDKFIVQIEVL